VYLHDHCTNKNTLKENVNVQIEVSEPTRKRFLSMGCYFVLTYSAAKSLNIATT